MAHVRTPAQVTDPIVEFCRTIVPTGGDPVFVEVDVPRGAAPVECFVNVDAMVGRYGGRSRHGWMILEWPGVLLEAQFHAVWERTDGSLVDVTPNDEPRTLFLADSIRVYDGTRTPSRQQALSSEPTVSRFIEACQELWSFETAHWYDDGNDAGLDLPTPEDNRVHWNLERSRVMAQLALYEHLGIVLPRS